MQGRKSFYFPPKVLYKNRHCNQDDFSVLVCGGINKKHKSVESITKFYCSEFKCEEFTTLPNPRNQIKTVGINSDLFVLGEYYENSKNNYTLTNFCNKTKTWSSKAQLRLDNNWFCVCSFKKNLYVIYKTG